MRCLYREKIYECGSYLEVDIFPVFKKPSGRRRRRAKPTNDVQTRLNQHNSEKALVRILNSNFTDEDIEITLTYSNENLPDTYEDAYKDAQNFLRRVKRLRRKRGLPDLKYVLVPGEGRFHFHIPMSGGIDRTELEKLWGYGYANSRQLQFSETGIEGLGHYIARQFEDAEENRVIERAKGRKRWSASKNLIRPEPKERDGKLSQKQVKELATVESESREAFENIYTGYYLSGCSPFYNDVNGGYYLCVRMYKKDAVFCNSKKRKKRRNDGKVALYNAKQMEDDYAEIL